MRAAIKVVATVVFLFFLLIAAFAQSQTKPQPSLRPPAPPRTPIVNPSPSQAGEEVTEEDVVRVTTNLVTSAALVIGREGKYVATLRRDDFHVFEDGVEQELAYFAAVDRPFTVALLIDNSHSTIFEIRNIQDAAIALVNRMRTNDRALIISLWLVVRARPAYSFGKAGTLTYENKTPVMAPLSDIEAVSQTFIENKRPLNSRWICKGPFVPWRLRVGAGRL